MFEFGKCKTSRLSLTFYQTQNFSLAPLQTLVTGLLMLILILRNQNDIFREIE
jgi:hypothetical protein